MPNRRVEFIHGYGRTGTITEVENLFAQIRYLPQGKRADFSVFKDLIVTCCILFQQEIKNLKKRSTIVCGSLVVFLLLFLAKNVPCCFVLYGKCVCLCLVENVCFVLC